MSTKFHFHGTNILFDDEELSKQVTMILEETRAVVKKAAADIEALLEGEAKITANMEIKPVESTN